MSESSLRERRSRAAHNPLFGVLEVVSMAFEFLLVGAFLGIASNEFIKMVESRPIGSILTPLSQDERYELLPWSQGDLLESDEILQGLGLIVAHEVLPALFQFTVEGVAAIVLFWWMYRRYMRGFVPSVMVTPRGKTIQQWPSVRPWPAWFGLHVSVPLSLVAWITIAFGIICFLATAYLERTLYPPGDDRRVLGFGNYVDMGGTIHRIRYARIAKMLVLTPLLEEIFFRGLGMYLFIRRGHSAFTAVLLANGTFALLHLSNLLGNFSPTYVMLQVPLAMLVGVFFSLRFMVTESLWEPILLHQTNNVLSSFIPAYAAAEFSSPLVWGSITTSVVVYGLFAVVSVRQLNSKSEGRAGKQGGDATKSKED